MSTENNYPYIYDDPNHDLHGGRCRMVNRRHHSTDLEFRDGSSMWDASLENVKKLVDVTTPASLGMAPKDFEEYRRNFKPEHYHSGGIDPWQFIEANLNPQQAIGFHLGNVLKYVARHEKKNGLEDLKKALDSLQEGIRLYEKQQPETDS